LFERWAGTEGSSGSGKSIDLCSPSRPLSASVGPRPDSPGTGLTGPTPFPTLARRPSRVRFNDGEAIPSPAPSPTQDRVGGCMKTGVRRAHSTPSFRQGLLDDDSCASDAPDGSAASTFAFALKWTPAAGSASPRELASTLAKLQQSADEPQARSSSWNGRDPQEVQQTPHTRDALNAIEQFYERAAGNSRRGHRRTYSEGSLSALAMQARRESTG